MLPMEKSVTFTGICANEIIPSIDCSFVYKAKEGRHVRITLNGTLISPSVLCLNCAFISRLSVIQNLLQSLFFCFNKFTGQTSSIRYKKKSPSLSVSQTIKAHPLDFFVFLKGVDLGNPKCSHRSI
jgi:hypothetical protein